MKNEIRACYVCGAFENETPIMYRSKKYSNNQDVCNKHYIQLQKYGKITDETKRSMKNKNEIVILDNFAQIILYNKDNKEVARANVDLKNVEKVKMYKWGYDSFNNYATTKTGGKFMCIHQLIMGTNNSSEFILIDHIDRNGLNNLEENLRITSRSINSINTNLRTSNNSGVTGVSWSESKCLWRSYISFNNKRKELGYRKLFDDAVVLRLKAEVKYYPDHPPQKELFEKYNIDWSQKDE